MIDRTRRARQVETQVPPWKDPWRRSVTHHYENMPPIGSFLTDSSTIVAADLDIALCPVRLHEPMPLRAVYFAAGSVEVRLLVATAIYRAQLAREDKTEMLEAPGRGLVFRLVAPVGVTATDAGDVTLCRHDLPVDEQLDAGLPLFLAFMVGNAAATFYSPATASAGSQAFVSGTPASRFNHWPLEITPALNAHAIIPYFVLRSAQGVKLYGDPAGL